MKFLFTADAHLSGYSQDPIIESLPERLHYIVMTLKFMADYCMAEGIKFFVIGGDIYHTKSTINSLAQSLLLDFIKEYPDLTFIIIDGNHDVSSKSGTGVSALQSLDDVPNVIMIHEDETIENIYFVAWNNKTIDRVRNGKADVLVSHFGLNEAQLSSGISIVSDIGLNDLKQYGLVLLGHYHKPQQVKHVWYVGDPIQLDWGEKNEVKRFLIVDSNTGDVESIETEGYRKHFEFEVTGDTQAEMLAEAEKLKAEGHSVKLKIISNDVDIDKIGDGFRIIDSVERDITNRGIDTSMTKDSILRKYIEIKEVQEKDISDYMDVGLEIINECVEEL